MTAGAFEGLFHAFSNGHGRHDDHELREAVALVQFVDGTRVHIGLAGTGFHLDGEVAKAPIGGVMGSRKVVVFLHGMQVLFQLACREVQPVRVSDAIVDSKPRLIRAHKSRDFRLFILWNA